MPAQNATGYDDWQQNEPTWDDGAYYVDESEPVAPAKTLIQRVWTGRPMIYVLAAGLITVTALVFVTRPGAEPAAAPTAAAPAAPALITYDAGPVIENEFNKP